MAAIKKLERKTRRLVVRPYRASDYTAWATAFLTQLPSRNTWDSAGRKNLDLSQKAFRGILKSQKARRDNDTFFGVFRKSDGALVGNVGLMDISRAVFQNAYLGYSILNPYWGQGYGKEAVRACIDIGFRDLGLHRIEAGIEPTNRRSICLARSIGMRHEGKKVRALYLRKKWIDLLVFALTTEDLKIKYRGPEPGFVRRS